MKFFKHYKNKPYQFLGIVRHSETQEQMALYETRYENTGGSLWVRPKEMFFENVVINGKQVPRFEKIPLDIISKTDITDVDLETIAKLIEQSFGEWDSKWFYSTYKSHKNFHLLIGIVEKNPVAFKLGYENDSGQFYSWLGGVIPEFRGLGIAGDLMTAQHEWCAKQGYTTIQTKTQNRFREMLLLNIKAGFEIIGTHLSDGGGLKIVLEKKLDLKAP